mgnify:CR=1 FL=1
MANETNKISIVFEGDSKKLQAAVKAAKKSLKDFDEKVEATRKKKGGLNGLSGTAKRLESSLVKAFAVREIYNFSKEALLLGARLQGVANAFQLIEDDGKTSMDALKEATRGAVSEIKLMELAVQAKNFKIPMENLASFFEFATIRAAQTGESVEYLTRSIVLGIGRKSPLILDNLGITLVRLKEAMGKVGRESATVAEISEGVSKIALEETEALKALGLASTTTAQEISKMTANFENWKASLGEDVTQTGFFEGIKNFITSEGDMMALRRMSSKLKEQLEMSKKEGDELFLSIVDANPDMIPDQQLALFAKALKARVTKSFSAAKVDISTMFGDPKELDNVTALKEWRAVATRGVNEMFKGGLLSEIKLNEMSRAIRALFQEQEAALNETEVAEEKLAQSRDGFFTKYEKQLKQVKIQYEKGFITSIQKAEREQSILRNGITEATMDVDDLGLASSDTYSAWVEWLEKTDALLKSNTLELEAQKNYLEAMKDMEPPELDADGGSESLDRFARQQKKLQELYGDAEEGFALYEGDDGTDMEGLNDATDEYLEKLQRMATMWGIVSQAIGGIANNIQGGSGFAQGVRVFAKLAQTAAATAAAVAAVRSAMGDPTAGPSTIATAVGVATALGGILGAVGGISTGGAGGASGSGGFYDRAMRDENVNRGWGVRGTDALLSESRARRVDARTLGG